jgi:hypothetical protein
MTIVTVMHTVRKAALYCPILTFFRRQYGYSHIQKQGRERLRESVTRNRKWKRKQTRFGNLVSQILQSKLYGRTEPKLLVSLKVTDRKQADFESLKEVMVMRRCFIGLSDRKCQCAGKRCSSGINFCYF